jgi:hypothetical protein
MSKDKKNVTKLVLDGGGSFGVAYVGVIKALHHDGVLSDIDTFIGSSVGAIMSMFLVLGYTPSEIHGIILELDFDKVYSMKSMNMFKSYTYGCRKYISKVVKTAINNKCNRTDITMKELYEKTGKTFVIHTTCICDNKPVYIDHTTHPDISVQKAIEMSISIPFIFPEVEHNGKYYVDGCVSQLPFHMYDESHLICLFNPPLINTMNKKEKFYFARQLVQTIGRVDTDHPFYKSLNIIQIPVGVIHSLSNPDTLQKEELIKGGFNATESFLQNITI